MVTSAYRFPLRVAREQIVMSASGRCWLWRSVKYEEVYLREYGMPREARYWLSRYLTHYNEKRPHSSLDYRTPAAVYTGKEHRPPV